MEKNPKRRQLYARTNDGPRILVFETIEMGLGPADHATSAGHVLQAVGFRGAVIFEAYHDDLHMWTSVVTFSDDIPQGHWNNTLVHGKSFA